jgi:hypothetical protein
MHGCQRGHLRAAETCGLLLARPQARVTRVAPPALERMRATPSTGHNRHSRSAEDTRTGDVRALTRGSGLAARRRRARAASARLVVALFRWRWSCRRRGFTSAGSAGRHAHKELHRATRRALTSRPAVTSASCRSSARARRGHPSGIDQRRDRAAVDRVAQRRGWRRTVGAARNGRATAPADGFPEAETRRERHQPRDHFRASASSHPSHAAHRDLCIGLNTES